MGRIQALPLTISLLLLVGCAGGGGEEDLALSIQKDLAAMTGCTFQAALTADYETQAFDYVLDVAWDETGGAALTIVEPAIARGVTAHIQNGRSELVYDGFSLDAGPLTGDGLTPLETLPALWRLFTRGYVTGERAEGGRIAVTCREGETPAGTGLEGTVCFDARSRVPLSGELFADGVRVAAVQIRDFRCMTANGG